MAEGYADDLTLLLKSLEYVEDLEQLNEILMIFEEFRKLSGLTINRSKTHVCPFGHIDNPSMLKLKDSTRLDFPQPVHQHGEELCHPDGEDEALQRRKGSSSQSTWS